jgi:hypothetical protein
MKKKKSIHEPKIDNFTKMHCQVGKQVAYRPRFAKSSLIGNCVEVNGDYITIDNGTRTFNKCHLGYVTVIFAEGIENGGDVGEVEL